MTEQAKQRADRRKEKERKEREERSLMRQRLIKIIDNPQTGDADALRAIEILHDMDERRY